MLFSNHWISKLAYVVERNMGYHPCNFQCSRFSGSNCAVAVWKLPSQVLHRLKMAIAYRVKIRPLPVQNNTSNN